MVSQVQSTFPFKFLLVPHVQARIKIPMSFRLNYKIKMSLQKTNFLSYDSKKNFQMAFG